MIRIFLLSLVVLLSGCGWFKDVNVIPQNPFPADIDLENCSYPLLDEQANDDTALADVYLKSLSEIELCNKRLEGVRQAKKKYQEVKDDD